MWTSKGRLPHLLRPDQYFSPEQHELEVETLFRPAWLCLAVMDEIPRHGDYVTRDAIGTPVLIRNEQGTPAAFLNVCAHRHGLVAREARGNSPRIRCGYHGWEYDAEGRMCKMPLAECFVPIGKGEFALRRFRTATLGRLIFVNLMEDGEGLEEFLGPEMTSELRVVFDDPALKMVYSEDLDYPCNWKVLMENTLEDYHVPIVHVRGIGYMPDKDHISHSWGDRYVMYQHHDPQLRTAPVRLAARRLRPAGRPWYVQHLSCPGLIFAGTSLTSHLHVTVPTSPTTCRTMVRLFLGNGRPGQWDAPLLHRLSRRHLLKVARIVLEEDFDICRDIQKGLESSPFRGVIGAREERVYAFQKYVSDATMGRDVVRPLHAVAGE
jgi:phenylpropionate dioxygenase-like ring-hydroxylating dioxygenase large terminal subunit